MLPDIALLKVFGFYVDEFREPITVRNYHWHILVHVCRNWRNVVFGSPLYLNLRLLCTHKTPVRETIDAWPPLPILVAGFCNEEWGVDNIVAALEHNDRIRELDFCTMYAWNFSSLDMDKVMAAMHRPFPALTYLRLLSKVELVPVDPSSFLGGSAPPQLQQLRLYSIPFPGIPKLLLSAIHLVNLHLTGIPHSGYISPEAMVTGLAALTSLEIFNISFESPRSRPDRKSRRPPPPTRTLLPALNQLLFHGVSEYLDDLVARIDAPLLNKLEMTFFYQLIFDSPQLIQFIRRTPKLKVCDEARVEFFHWGVRQRATTTYSRAAFELGFSCTQSDWQLSFVAQVLSSGLFPAVKLLDLIEQRWNSGNVPFWQDDIQVETGQWLEVLHPLTAVKDLYLSPGFAPLIAPTLQELVGGRVTEVLPALQGLHLEGTLSSGPVQESFEKWVAARQLAGCPVAVSQRIHN